MPPERRPGSAQDWLARAQSDLALSRVDPPHDVLVEDLCYHAQQAAEKARKAVYRDRDWPFAYVHDVGALLDELEKHGLALPAEIRQAAKLTPFATSSRYPGVQEPVTPAEHREAVKCAERVVNWARAMVLKESA